MNDLSSIDFDVINADYDDKAVSYVTNQLFHVCLRVGPIFVTFQSEDLSDRGISGNGSPIATSPKSGISIPHLQGPIRPDSPPILVVDSLEDYMRSVEELRHRQEMAFTRCGWRCGQFFGKGSKIPLLPREAVSASQQNKIFKLAKPIK